MAEPTKGTTVALLSPEYHTGDGHAEMGDQLLVIRRQHEKGGFEGQL